MLTHRPASSLDRTLQNRDPCWRRHRLLQFCKPPGDEPKHLHSPLRGAPVADSLQSEGTDGGEGEDVELHFRGTV